MPSDLSRTILYQWKDIRTIAPAAVPALLAALPPTRQEKVMALRQERKRLQSLAAGLLAQNLLALAGISDTLLQYEERGKPFIAGHPEWHISLSHSGAYALCALSRAPVAVDVQRHGGRYASILRIGYAPAERAFCESAPDREQAFYDLWCRKECKAKLRPYARLREIDALAPEPGFRFWHLARPGYSAALYGAAEYACAECQGAFPILDPAGVSNPRSGRRFQS